MEIRINKEIKDYHESLFMGLSMRQFMCSAGYWCVVHRVGRHIDGESRRRP